MQVWCFVENGQCYMVDAFYFLNHKVMEELGKTRHGLQNRNLLISIKVLMPFSSTRIGNDKHTKKR